MTRNIDGGDLEMARLTWIKEPLIHIALLAILVFLLVGLVDPGGIGDNRVVVLGKNDVLQIVGIWEERMGRRPTPQELTALVQGHLRKEILYREAVALGLDKTDPAIRRRLIKKLFAQTMGTADFREPTESELRGWLELRQEMYRVPARVSINHVYFSTESRGARVVADAGAFLAEFNAQEIQPEHPWEAGDPFPLGHGFVDTSMEDIANIFGNHFAEDIMNREIGRWQGPVASFYGVHVVIVREKTPSHVPRFEEIRQSLLTDWQDGQFWNSDEPEFEQLATQYEVEAEADAKALLQEREIDLTEILP
jgi:peptidyl-prolyl cis-trans isomerase C